jgi:hypothetical protein
LAVLGVDLVLVELHDAQRLDVVLAAIEVAGFENADEQHSCKVSTGAISNKYT